MLIFIYFFFFIWALFNLYPFYYHIKLIQNKIGISSLPENLQEIALLRVENEDMSLKELGEMLNPPISKSGVNHRLKKIEQIANDLK